MIENLEISSWWGEIAAAWVRHLRRRNLAANTIKSYRWAALDLGRWLQAAGVEGPQELSREHLHRWQDSLQDRELAPISRAAATSAVRNLLRWCSREQLLAVGLWEHVDPVSVPDRSPRSLPPQDLERILAHYGRPGGGLDRLRDRALFLFLLTSGARISEALRVRVDQVGRRMVVTQKGGHEHALVISERAQAWVGDYLRARGPDRVAALWIVSNRFGRRPMDLEDANGSWRRLAGRLRIRPFTSHWIRGTNATELDGLGFSDTARAAHLGHRNTRSIHRYTSVRDERRQDMADRLDALVPPAPRPALLPPISRRRGRPGRQAPDARAGSG